jgi:DNA repair protein RadC
MSEKEQIIAELSPEEMAFLDRMLERLREEGLDRLSREELVGIIAKTVKDSKIDIGNLVQKLK